MGEVKDSGLEPMLKSLTTKKSNVEWIVGAGALAASLGVAYLVGVGMDLPNQTMKEALTLSAGGGLLLGTGASSYMNRDRNKIIGDYSAFDLGYKF